MRRICLLLFLSLIEIVYCTRFTDNADPVLPLVVTTWGTDGFVESTKNAVYSLPKGRMAALVDGLSTCERMQCDTTVGYGGSPDEKGETTLDALLIDGVGMKMGAVAGMHKVKDAARVAWAVMNFTKHTLLVGQAATDFAIQMGFPSESLSTNVSEKMITDWKANKCQPNYWRNVQPNSRDSCGPYKPDLSRLLRRNLAASEEDQEGTTQYEKIYDRFNHDTIGMVVIDAEGNITAGTSTNGAKYKIPGRVGDSPIPGSGAYVVRSVGAAAATGDGDVMMRFLPSLQTLMFMQQGAKPGRATRKALQAILAVFPKFQGAVIAADVKGRIGAACTNFPEFEYVVGRPSIHGSGSANVTVYKMKCMT